MTDKSENQRINTVEDGEEKEGRWGNMGTLKEKNIRIGFIRKVFLILSAQLTFTFGIVLLCVLKFVYFVFLIFLKKIKLVFKYLSDSI